MENMERILPEVILIRLEARTDQEAIGILAGRLHELGIVKESYRKAVQEREKDFSTGLAFEEMGVAIPHTDACHVNRSALAVGILKEPVIFRHMGMPEIPVKTEMLFMIAAGEDASHLEFLGNFMDAFQKKGCLRTLKAASTREEFLAGLSLYLKENTKINEEEKR